MKFLEVVNTLGQLNERPSSSMALESNVNLRLLN